MSNPITLNMWQFIKIRKASQKDNFISHDFLAQLAYAK